jgi:hypothetical protein
MFDFQSLVKYLLEGLAVAVAAFLIPKKNIDAKEIGLIALTAAAMFAVLDQFAPEVGAGARQGAGFGIGANMVGFPVAGAGYGLEGFDDSGEFEGYYDSVDHPDGVCKQNSDQQCTYDPEVKDHQKAQFLCRQDSGSGSGDGGQCTPQRACQQNDDGTCQWTDGAKDLNDVKGRTCQMEDVEGKQVCQLGYPQQAQSTQSGQRAQPAQAGQSSQAGQQAEGFTSGEIAGFEGFSKVF